MTAEPKKLKDPDDRHRKTLVVVLAIGIFVLFFVVFSQAAFNLTFLRPSTSEQTLIFAAISALIFLLLVALSFVLVRNLIKLFAERRVGKPGSKFRSRMVVGALILSLGPVITLYCFSYGLMNRSIDKWFSRPVEELREDSGEIAAQLSEYAFDNARAEATSIAAVPETAHAFATSNFSSLITEFRRRESTLQNGFALAIVDDEAVASFHAPEPWALLRSHLPQRDSVERSRPVPLQLNGREYMVGTAPVGANGKIIVA
ncbi:MAG: nitrogen regulation protein NtrY, partial [Acidobacteriaceae bacterium]|nr:nitrogen regulation protein NtrY [Acidobacteriaceae bacterium]